MEDIEENEPLRISALKEKSSDTNRMSSFSSHLRKNRPKSLRFRFDDSRYIMYSIYSFYFKQCAYNNLILPHKILFKYTV